MSVKNGAVWVQSKVKMLNKTNGQYLINVFWVKNNPKATFKSQVIANRNIPQEVRSPYLIKMFAL